MSLFLNESELSDFISPGEVCIKPELYEEKDQATVAPNPSVEIDNGAPSPQKISLSDCLACSGCITSAESVLVGLQTVEEFYTLLNDPNNVVVVSLSPQVRASFAKKFNWNLQEAQFYLERFFEHLKVAKTLDLVYFRQLVLEEVCNEFEASFNGGGKLPLMASSCPGWVCLVEKTHGWLTDSLSKVKSAQALAGTYAKKVLAQRICSASQRLLHVAVMPCFDKKLEASRSQLRTFDGVMETDLVVTPIELEVDFGKFMSQFHEQLPALLPPVYSDIGNSSGGFLPFIIRFMASRLLGVDLGLINFDNGVLDLKCIKVNEDSRLGIKSVSLVDDSGNVLLNTAYVYGFRSIQNMIRRLEPKLGSKDKFSKVSSRRAQLRAQAGVRKREDAFDLAKFHYLEVMACPKGCINGGAQLRPAASDAAKDYAEAVEERYQSVTRTNLSLTPQVGSLRSLFATQMSRDVLYTSFKPVTANERTSNVSLSW